MKRLDLQNFIFQNVIRCTIKIYEIKKLSFPDFLFNKPFQTKKIP